MSTNGGDSDKADENDKNPESKPSLSSVTHKLKVEALRRYKQSQGKEESTEDQDVKTTTDNLDSENNNIFVGEGSKAEASSGGSGVNNASNGQENKEQNIGGESSAEHDNLKTQEHLLTQTDEDNLNTIENESNDHASSDNKNDDIIADDEENPVQRAATVVDEGNNGDKQIINTEDDHVESDVAAVTSLIAATTVIVDNEQVQKSGLIDREHVSTDNMELDDDKEGEKSYNYKSDMKDESLISNNDINNDIITKKVSENSHVQHDSTPGQVTNAPVDVHTSEVDTLNEVNNGLRDNSVDTIPEGNSLVAGMENNEDSIISGTSQQQGEETVIVDGAPQDGDISDLVSGDEQERNKVTTSVEDSSEHGGNRRNEEPTDVSSDAQQQRDKVTTSVDGASGNNGNTDGNDTADMVSNDTQDKTLTNEGLEDGKSTNHQGNLNIVTNGETQDVVMASIDGGTEGVMDHSDTIESVAVKEKESTLVEGDSVVIDGGTEAVVDHLDTIESVALQEKENTLVEGDSVVIPDGTIMIDDKDVITEGTRELNGKEVQQQNEQSKDQTTENIVQGKQEVVTPIIDNTIMPNTMTTSGDGDQTDENVVVESTTSETTKTEATTEDLSNEITTENQMTESGEEASDEIVLTDDFFYKRDTSLFKPSFTEGVPENLLSLHHSFGFECTKRENLHILDSNTMMFSSGNLVSIVNVITMDHIHIGGTNTGGIGAITVHPSRKFFAVAEKGDKPVINIYEYPSLKLFRVLREGTLEAYAHLNFSPHGTKLASLGSSPDFMLTLWDWKNEKVILRSKAFSQDVYKVAFSPENEGHLCTSGTGHIRFWSMANTFTGLKLQGELGRFGTTELTDIEGFVELPDGKVLSGSEWGNMLLWDGGLIKVEICKKGNKLCHNGMIEQFFMDEGELMTIGADGFIKVWDFEKIDNADITDEKNRVFEMEPMYEIKVGADVKLKSMVKSVNPNTPTIWYGQDASGAVWKLDLSFTHTSHAPELLYSCHSGNISCVEASPIAHMVATCGHDCTIRLYDYVEKLPLCMAKYSAPATSLLWLPEIADSKCTSILCGFADGVVRFLTVARDEAFISRTKKKKSNLEFQLTQVFKPHTKSVTSIVINKTGKILATGSEDCTVFFFKMEETCKPIGFIETASPVISLSWINNAADSGAMLVFCKDGAVLDVRVPDFKKVDTNKTYKIPLQDLVKREFMFARVKDKLLKAEEDARKAKIKEEKMKRKEEERKRRRARGIEEEEEEVEEEEEEEGEEETEEAIDHGPCVAITGFPSIKLDTFWMLMDGWDAGYIYECQFAEEDSQDATATTTAQEPINAIKLVDGNDVPIQSYNYCNSGDFVLFGMANGVVRIHPVHGKNVLDSLTTYWTLHIHDSQYGAINALCTSFDDKYVFTVGADGNFFVYNFMSEAKLKESKPLVQSLIPKLQTVIGEDGLEVPKTIDDIDDPQYYSIELEKQKAEHDRMVKIADEKKQNVRRDIAKLRRSFKSLLKENESLPERFRIRSQELEIDPEIRRQQEEKTVEKIDLVRKELKWESEKHSIGLKKLQDRFKSMLECDRIVLYSCSSSHKVSSFRSSKLSDLYYVLRDAMAGRERRGTLIKDQKKLSIAGVKGALPVKRRSTQVDVRKKSHQPSPGGGEVGGKVAKALEKAEQRRKKKELRKAEWEELYKSKPDENYQDPKDVSAIKEAKDNMGDYKLKTAEDFVVPEGQRVNAEIKLEQLLNLLEQIHYHKERFNEKLLALRNKKLNIIDEVKENVLVLKRVQQKLDYSIHKPLPKIPKMRPEEMPEKKLSYNKETLYAFKKQLQNTKVKSNAEGGGFGGFGGSESKPPTSTAGGRDRAFSNVSVLSGGRPKSHQSTKMTEQSTREAILENVEETPSTLETLLEKQEQIRLKYEQDRLLKKIETLLTNFDGALKTLRHDKAQFEVTLKNADLRHVTLFEELMLLKEFEKRETTFADRVRTREDEKLEMEEKVENCQIDLDVKKEEIDKYQEQEKTLYSAFSSMIGENNKFEGFLTKVFKKKIKRAKKKDESLDNSDDDSDEEESDEELSSSEESNSDEDVLDDSVCPPGCDQTLFDQVCQLRENRLDIEEFLTEEKKALDTLKKEHEALNKRYKIINSALSTAEAELEAFQREKQQKLNELDVVVSLRLHQIQYIVNNSMPQDLSSCLVFINFDQKRLQERIKELEVEKAEQKRLFREHRQMHVQLKRDKKAREAEITELEEKVKNMQMLKFGRLVDFEKLENISVNRTAEELKERLRQQEFQNAADLVKWEKKITSYREKLTFRTRENTGRLNTSTLLFHERIQLEHDLDSKQKSLGAQYSGNRKSDLKERGRLVQLVQLQAQEIDALKDEITLLSRKGGHILPPSQPPLPSAVSQPPAIPNI